MVKKEIFFLLVDVYAFRPWLDATLTTEISIQHSTCNNKYGHVMLT